ncbi:MAG: hypothetical protein LBI31_06615 [Zoogloeaceae bacterium]|jgi:hypothetical protein|nr:hypothetical protein [Zoogloeaceae bacterium]
MNLFRKSGSPDDLPVLTEVVVPSPVGIKTPESDFPMPLPAAPAKEEAELFSDPNPDYADGNEDEGEDEEATETRQETSAFHDEEAAALLASPDIRETLAEVLRERFFTEIPALIETTLRNTIPILTEDIQEGLEEIAKSALKDLIVSLRAKNLPPKT